MLINTCFFYKKKNIILCQFKSTKYYFFYVHWISENPVVHWDRPSNKLVFLLSIMLSKKQRYSRIVKINYRSIML